MRVRRTDLSGSEAPPKREAESVAKSFEGRPPEPPADALEAASARALRVAELRRAVAEGRYRPDGRKVAEALLRSRTRRALFGDDH